MADAEAPKLSLVAKLVVAFILVMIVAGVLKLEADGRIGHGTLARALALQGDCHHLAHVVVVFHDQDAPAPSSGRGLRR